MIRYQANETDLLSGARFEDAILRGTYRVDIHHSEDNGITFKELNGDMLTEYGKNSPPVRGNWQEKMGLDGTIPGFTRCFSPCWCRKSGPTRCLPAA